MKKITNYDTISIFINVKSYVRLKPHEFVGINSLIALFTSYLIFLREILSKNRMICKTRKSRELIAVQIESET